MNIKQVILGAAIIGGSWVVGGALMLYLFSDSPSRGAYALLVGWWFSAYLSSKLEIPVTSVIPLGVVYYVAFTMSGLFGKDWFYHDIQGANVGWILLLGLTNTIAVVSPILFDWIFRKSVQVHLHKICQHSLDGHRTKQERKPK